MWLAVWKTLMTAQRQSLWCPSEGRGPGVGRAWTSMVSKIQDPSGLEDKAVDGILIQFQLVVKGFQSDVFLGGWRGHCTKWIWVSNILSLLKSTYWWNEWYEHNAMTCIYVENYSWWLLNSLQGLVSMARPGLSATWLATRAPAPWWAASWRPPASVTPRKTTPWAGGLNVITPLGSCSS